MWWPGSAPQPSSSVSLKRQWMLLMPSDPGQTVFSHFVSVRLNSHQRALSWTNDQEWSHKLKCWILSHSQGSNLWQWTALWSFLQAKWANLTAQNKRCSCFKAQVCCCVTCILVSVHVIWMWYVAEMLERYLWNTRILDFQKCTEQIFYGLKLNTSTSCVC